MRVLALLLVLLHPHQRDDVLAANALRALQHVAVHDPLMLRPVCFPAPQRILAAAMDRLVAMWPPAAASADTEHASFYVRMI